MTDSGSILLLERTGQTGAGTETARDSGYISCTAELADCTCPEYCERDHDTD
jgi:hypothetical protein